MKTPWSDLLQYGAGIAVIIVILFASILLLAVVGVAVVLTKIMWYIK
jgi:hypothetical protein